MPERLPRVDRRCRSCGKKRRVDALAAACPDCGATYGRLEIGMDTPPPGTASAPAWPTGAAIESARERAYKDWLNQRPPDEQQETT